MYTRKITTIIIGIIVLGLGIYFLLGLGSGEPAPQATTTPATLNTGEPERAVIGTSVEGREIESFTYGNGDTHIAFVGAIHGGYEWNTVLLSRKLMSYIEANPDIISDNLTVTVIPVLNPDGLFEVVGTVGSFTAADAPGQVATEPGRFNANGVDLNRNFDCNWQPESTWRGRSVDAGTAAFSEPEAKAFKDFVERENLDVAILFHSAANGVYGASCNDGILAEGETLMNTYADASGYPAIESFDHYEITGDAEGWLAKIGIPSISVELTSHETVEWKKNIAGIEAVLDYYGK